jgi:hypothetical protein
MPSLPVEKLPLKRELHKTVAIAVVVQPGGVLVLAAQVMAQVVVVQTKTRHQHLRRQHLKR